ncbi:MAG: O-antigen ligase family protein [Armatimonadetes bacterium]|nr:O-antigen ligase family protein [Armatimonadota bacterium]
MAVGDIPKVTINRAAESLPACGGWLAALQRATKWIGSSGRWLWPLVLLFALVGGLSCARLSTALVVAAVSVALVIAVFVWRQGDPMIPFLLLIAAIPGGVLLRVSLSGLPVETVTPFLGVWVVVAILVSQRGRSLAHTSAPLLGRWLRVALLTLACVITVTLLAQSWRTEGKVLELGEILTLIQLGVLVVVSAYLLVTPQRALLVAYVIVAAGGVISLLAVADSAGLIALGTGMTYLEGYTRQTGLLTDPNFFSFQLLISLAFALHLALASESPRKKVIFWCVSALLIGGVITTYSAGALVGVGAVVLAAMALEFRVSGGRAIVALALVLATATVIALLTPADYGEAVAEKYGELSLSSFEEIGTKRGAAWEAGFRQIAESPVLGVGLSTENTMRAIARQYTLSVADRKAAHNTYITMAVGSGVIGLAAYIAVLVGCLAVTWSSYARATLLGAKETATACGCLLVSLVVIIAQGMQLDLQFEKYVWLVVGACLAVHRWSFDHGRQAAAC